MSDVERMERMMNQTKFANKSIVKIFGKHIEEFRREMHYNKEIINSDILSQNIPDSMIKHAESINLPQRTSDPFKHFDRVKQTIEKKDSFNLDEGEVRTSNLSSNRMPT